MVNNYLVKETVVNNNNNNTNFTQQSGINVITFKNGSESRGYRTLGIDPNSYMGRWPHGLIYQKTPSNTDTVPTRFVHV